MKKLKIILLSFVISSIAVYADDTNHSSKQLAQKLSNPISELISVPIEYTYDNDIGPKKDGYRSAVAFKPVIPIELNEDWIVISRTIVSATTQKDIAPGTGTQDGFSDMSESLFISPKKATSSGWIWGAGPVFLIPTANDDLLGSGKWAAGPTVVLLRQDGPWTYGVLANHLWSFAGDSKRDEINATYFDPWLAYTTESAYTFSIESEPTYTWNSSDWGVPVNFMVTKVTKFGNQIVSIGGGAKYWADETLDGPKGFGAIFQIIFLFPQ